MVELAQPRKLVPRWPGHGDLTIVIDGAYTYLRADQVENLAGITPWGDGETVLGDEWPLDVDGIPFYTLPDALAKCERRGTADSAGFTAWLQDFLTTVDDDTLELAHRPVSFTDAYTVARAAHILNSQPHIRIGRDRLFDLMDRLGWIERSSADHDWIITKLAHSRDLLTMRAVTIPAANKDGRRSYLQIHVTKAGLAALNAHLTPATTDTPALAEAPPSPPLF